MPWDLELVARNCEQVVARACRFAAVCGLVVGTSTVAAAQSTTGDSSGKSASSGATSGEGTSSSSTEAVEQLDLGALLNPDVQSASLIAEPISEAPAPITVITPQMIEAIGARNLKEVLTTYVPGMTNIGDRNELNVAMRGIYTSSQQKILILINGHRVNSRVFSSAPPDFSIGIDPAKIEQIEIVRGPGSAVYGNLALNGIINIVTKSPEEIGGAKVEAGLGSHGQQTGSGVVGKSFSEETGVVMWGSYFRSGGQSYAVPESERFNAIEAENPRATLMQFEDPPSFDVGAQMKFGNFTLFFDMRQGKWSPPFTSFGQKSGQTYDYDSYDAWNGVKPGQASFSTHSSLAYERKLADNLSIRSTLYFDTNETQQRGVIRVRQPTQKIKLNTAVGWSEQTIGNITQLTLDYDAGPVGGGNVVVGGQIDSYRVTDSYWITGDALSSDGKYGSLNSVYNENRGNVLPEGTETFYSGFAQLKHKFGFNRDVIANLGVRYDFKDRHDYTFRDRFRDETREVGGSIDALSPRLALIFGPESKFGAKFSYSESFVDAPYFQRTNRTRNLRGSPDLRPEKLRAFQLTPTLRLLDRRLRNSINFFWAEQRDIIFRKKTLDKFEPLFANTAQLSVVGVENEFAFLEDDYRIRANATFQRPVRHAVYGVTDGQIDNVPQFFANVVVDARPLWFLRDNIWLSLAGRFYSSQPSPVNIRYTVSRPGRAGGTRQVTYQQPNRRLPARFLLRSSLRWKNILKSNFNFQFTIDNILNTTYHQGGTTSHPYRQPGRWVLFELGYDASL